MASVPPPGVPAPVGGRICASSAGGVGLKGVTWGLPEGWLQAGGALQGALALGGSPCGCQGCTSPSGSRSLIGKAAPPAKLPAY